MTFTVPLKDTTVGESESAELQCAVSKPKQPVTWEKNKEEVTPDDRVTIEEDSGTHTLTINNVTPDDDAEYTVYLGDQSTSAKLTVEGWLLD